MAWLCPRRGTQRRRTLRIRQLNGLDLSIVVFDLAVPAPCEIPLSDFHGVSRAGGPKGQLTRLLGTAKYLRIRGSRGDYGLAPKQKRLFPTPSLPRSESFLCRVRARRATSTFVVIPPFVRLRDAALVSARHQQPVDSLRMATPRVESSSSNCATPGETTRSPGTITAHSRFSRNSLDLICHWPKDDDFASPIWIMDQYRTNANAVASAGNGPDRIKWLFPCTRMPTI
jgi:hypothetical protein